MPTAHKSTKAGGLQAAVANRLTEASAFVAFVVLPVAMVVANKSAPAALGLAAVVANAAVVASDGSRVLMDRYLQALKTGAAYAVVLLLAVATASLLWTIDPAMTRRGILEAVPELAFGWGLAAAWPGLLRASGLRWLPIGLLAAAVLIIIEHQSGMPLHNLFGARGAPYDLKRSAVTLALMLWPALAIQSARGQLWTCVTLAVGVGAAAFAAHSAASVVAVLLGVAVLFGARLLPRASLVAIGALSIVLLTLAPWTGTIANRIVSVRAETMLQQQHASHRIQIWSAFERHIRDKHLIGHGFNTSFRVADTVEGIAATFGPSADKAIDNIHPHNVLLQVWIEFGLLGAILTAVALVFIFSRLSALDPARRAYRLAFLVGAAALALVGLNAWSPWWLAVVALCLSLFRIERERPDQ